MAYEPQTYGPYTTWENRPELTNPAPAARVPADVLRYLDVDVGEQIEYVPIEGERGMKIVPVADHE